MTELFLVLISTVFVNNLLLDLAIGTDPVMSYSKRLDIAYGFSIALILLLPVATTIAYLAYYYLLVPSHSEYFKVLFFCLIVLSSMVLLKRAFRNLNGYLTDIIDNYYPIAGLNAVVLGTILLSLDLTSTLLQAIIFSVGNAIGCGLALIIFTCLRYRLETTDIPIPFKGAPIDLISIGILAMAFVGFNGLIVI